MSPYSRRFYEKIIEEYSKNVLQAHPGLPLNDKVKALNKGNINSMLNEISSKEEAFFNECKLDEEKYLRNGVASNMRKLKVSIRKINDSFSVICAYNFVDLLKACYNVYAKLACEEPPTFQCVLIRLFLWEMLINSEVPRINFSLVDIDNLLGLYKINILLQV